LGQLTLLSCRLVSISEVNGLHVKPSFACHDRYVEFSRSLAQDVDI